MDVKGLRSTFGGAGGAEDPPPPPPPPRGRFPNELRTVSTLPRRDVGPMGRCIADFRAAVAFGRVGAGPFGGFGGILTLLLSASPRLGFKEPLARKLVARGASRRGMDCLSGGVGGIFAKLLIHRHNIC